MEVKVKALHQELLIQEVEEAVHILAKHLEQEGLA